MSIETKSDILFQNCQDIVEHIFGSSFEYNVETETYLVGIDEKPMLIDNHITYNMTKKEIVKLVSQYGVFNAVELYNNTYGDLSDFPIESMTFTKLYPKLAYVIIDEYINENELVIEGEEEVEVDDVINAQIG